MSDTGRTLLALAFIAFVIAAVVSYVKDNTEEGRAERIREDDRRLRENERRLRYEQCMRLARPKYAAIVDDPYKREQAAQAECE